MGDRKSSVLYYNDERRNGLVYLIFRRRFSIFGNKLGLPWLRWTALPRKLVFAVGSRSSSLSFTKEKLRAQSYLTLQHWCSHANRMRAAFHSGRSAMEASSKQGCFFTIELHCSCINAGKLARIGPLVYQTLIVNLWICQSYADIVDQALIPHEFPPLSSC